LEKGGSGYEGISLKNALQMSSGIRFTEDYGDLKSDICALSKVWIFNAPVYQSNEKLGDDFNEK